MITDWQNLSERERFLIAIAAFLVLLLALQFAVISPLRQWHAGAVAERDAALTFRANVEAALANAEQPQAIKSGNVASIVSDMAGAADLRLVRRNILQDGAQIEVVFENVKLADFNRFLIDLQETANITARQGSLRPQGNGLYTAQFILARG
jgi:type II secretory pathway component PulM